MKILRLLTFLLCLSACTSSKYAPYAQMAADIQIEYNLYRTTTQFDAITESDTQFNVAMAGVLAMHHPQHKALELFIQRDARMAACRIGQELNDRTITSYVKTNELIKALTDIKKQIPDADFCTTKAQLQAFCEQDMNHEQLSWLRGYCLENVTFLFAQ